jgi:hypothetical protein
MDLIFSSHRNMDIYMEICYEDLMDEVRLARSRSQYKQEVW